MSPPPKLSRRGMTIGAGAAAAAALVAGAVFEIPRLLRRRSGGEYGDLVSRLDDPDAAATLGRTLLPPDSGGTGPTLQERATADLRKRLSHGTLAELMAQDCADVHLMVEAGGWVVPLVLAELCILAAS